MYSVYYLLCVCVCVQCILFVMCVSVHEYCFVDTQWVSRGLAPAHAAIKQRVGRSAKTTDSSPQLLIAKMSASADFSNPLRKFKLVFLGEQSGKCQVVA